MAFQYVDCPPAFRELLQNIFTDDFMKAHTRFQSFEGFCYSSAVFVNWNKEQLVYDDVVFNNFVRESTCFPDWDSMVCKATDLHFSAAAG